MLQLMSDDELKQEWREWVTKLRFIMDAYAGRPYASDEWRYINRQLNAIKAEWRTRWSGLSPLHVHMAQLETQTTQEDE